MGDGGGDASSVWWLWTSGIPRSRTEIIELNVTTMTALNSLSRTAFKVILALHLIVRIKTAWRIAFGANIELSRTNNLLNRQCSMIML